MSFICITNNKSLYEKYKNDFEIKLYNTGFREILIAVRDFVHKGHKLLTHPLSGSVKPKETFIKTVFISFSPAELDYDSLSIIESSIVTFDKFADKQINYDENRADFECVDMALAESALHSLL